MLGQPGDGRSRLAEKGIVFGLSYTGEVFGNPVGGRRRGLVYNGLVEPQLDIDFEKLSGWTGLKFHALGYYPHGTSGSRRFVGDAGIFSNIDFYDSPRLFELWFDQTLKLGALGTLSLRAGQLAADSEFANAEAGSLFLHSSFGACPVFAANVPVPIYAIAAPGLRLRWEPQPWLYLQAAVFDGNPDPDTLGDPSPGSVRGTTYNRHGLRFHLDRKEGALVMWEIGWLRNQGEKDTGLPGALRLGGFRHTDTFSDLRYDRTGRSLADPLSSGLARALRGNWGIYAVAEHTLWQAPIHGGEGMHPASPVANANAMPNPAMGPARPSLRAFVRLGYAPPDRSPTTFYLDSGLAWRGPWAARPRDILGLGFSYSRASQRLRDLTRDRNAFNGTREPLPDHEAIVELTYQANLAPWLQIQPDLQYILHPGASRAVRNALVLGVRSVVTF